jgi:hypothetical protein
MEFVFRGVNSVIHSIDCLVDHEDIKLFHINTIPRNVEALGGGGQVAIRDLWDYDWSADDPYCYIEVVGLEGFWFSDVNLAANTVQWVLHKRPMAATVTRVWTNEG